MSRWAWRRRDEPDAWTPDRLMRLDLLAIHNGDVAQASTALAIYEAQERRPARRDDEGADRG